MIVEALISLFVGIVTGILDLLPGSPAAPDLAGAVRTMLASDVAHWVRALVGDWVPLSTLVSALGVLIAWFGGLAVFRLVSWALALIHVGGTESA